MPSCRGRALALLAARARSEEELGRKLLADGYPDSDVAETVAELVASGELSETASAETFVRLRRNRWGKERLELELRKRFFREETIRAALAGLGPDEDMDLARRLSGGRPEGDADPAARRRLFAKLRRKGISVGVAMKLVGSRSSDDE